MSQGKKLKEKGYVLFSSEPSQTMLDVAEMLGSVFKVSSMPLVQTLTPRLKECEYENTYSGNYGINEFPFHTDLAHWYTPPRYLFLRCAVPAEDVETKIIDSKEIIEDIDSELLCRSHFLPRKRLDRNANLLRILHGAIFRWDSKFIEPVNKLAKNLKLHIEDRIHNIQSERLVLGSAGDCLLIDNWRMLHGRSSVSKTAMNRKIERVYFNEVKV